EVRADSYGLVLDAVGCADGEREDPLERPALAMVGKDPDPGRDAGSRPAVVVEAEREPLRMPRLRSLDETEVADGIADLAGDAESCLLVAHEHPRRRRGACRPRLRVEPEVDLREPDPGVGVCTARRLHVSNDDLVPELQVTKALLADEIVGRDQVGDEAHVRV